MTSSKTRLRFVLPTADSDGTIVTRTPVARDAPLGRARTSSKLATRHLSRVQSEGILDISTRAPNPSRSALIEPMPQKQLKGAGKKINKIGKKAPAANKHGKGSITKKGKFNFKPKLAGAGSSKLLEKIRASKGVSRSINDKNELEAARRATATGGKMAVVRPPPDARVEVRGPKPKKSNNKGPVVKTPAKTTLNPW